MTPSDSQLIRDDILAYLDHHENKELLRFLTCGSVDDGKSTLIGRLLHDTQTIFDDQLEALRRDTRKVGKIEDDIDLSLIVDGLQAEREQGITIDVAYRYFSTSKRKFIIADCPGHEQYTRNMTTGASNSDVAVILVDATHGVLPQTKRHTFITHLLGITHVIVAINKMDLINFEQRTFENIRNEFLNVSSGLDFEQLLFIPISAYDGDNVVRRSQRADWYQGPTLIELLESTPLSSERLLTKFCMPVQRVNRPNSNFRGYSGTIRGGTIHPGDRVTVLPSNHESTVNSIVTMQGNLDEAFAPMSVTLTLDDEIDISRGDVLMDSSCLPTVSDSFDATIVWMDFKPLTPNKRYIIKHGSKQVNGQIDEIRFVTDVHDFEPVKSDRLEINHVGYCKVSVASPLVIESYGQSRSMGSFIVIDRLSNITVGAGMIGARAATNQVSKTKASARVSVTPRQSGSTDVEGELSFSVI